MLVTVGLLVPTQWFAYRHATRPAPDATFPISAWSDPRYFSTAVQTRTVQPLLRRIIEETAVRDPSGSGAGAGGSGAEPTPSPSGGTVPTPSVTPTPTPSPTTSISPTPRPGPPQPRIEIRAEAIDPPDNSNNLFYRWRIHIENPTNGGWLKDVKVVTQVPLGMRRVQCNRGIALQGSRAANAAPGYQCQTISPEPSEDGHDLVWEESELRPGYVRVYTFDVRVTAGNGEIIRNHAHLRWGSSSVSTGTCSFAVNKSAPQTCRAESA